MIENLSPIVLFVYNRPIHTEHTLNALMHSDLADESILYIYADGAKKNATEEQLLNIQEVRRIIHSKQWCKHVNIIESDINKGLANSIKTGVTEIVNKFDKVIVLEDDLITSKAFLSYMNKALDYYAERKSVFSISAYNLPKKSMPIPDDYEFDVYVNLRNSSWGWATWADRWTQIDWGSSTYNTILKSNEMQKSFNRGGDDLFDMLIEQQNKTLNVWAILFTLSHFNNHAVSIVPTISYVDNLGLDGSGENCSISESLRNESLNLNSNPKFLPVIYQDKRFINAFYNAYCATKRPLWQKLINRISRLVGCKNIFVIKKKIYA